MILKPRLDAAAVIAAILAGTTIPACNETPEPPRDPPGPRAQGPTVDPAILANDAAVGAFRVEAMRYHELRVAVAPLEAALADGTISEADTVRWRELETELGRERGRLNRFMYAEGITPAQRAAMWWVLEGEPATDGNP